MDRDRAEEVADEAEEMIVLRNVLSDQRPIVLKMIEIFGAKMYRQGVREAARAAREKDYGDRRKQVA